MTAIFVYGTLRDQALRETLCRGPIKFEPAVLPDHTVLVENATGLPVLVQRAGAEAEGLLLTDLTDMQSDALDAYEVPFGYDKVTREVNGQQATVYMPPAGQETGGAWDLAVWQREHGEVSRYAAEEIAANNPPLTPDELKRWWDRIRHRAFCRYRAAHNDGTAKVRRESGHAEIVSTSGLYGNFFKYREMQIQHDTFTGGTSPKMPREGFHGADASLILPYDPKTDRVMMVEQMRVGPLLRGDRNPWMLEPIAGMVDAGETPLEAAVREAEEEAGLKLDKIIELFGGYPSPGNASEYHYCFVALTDLPERDSYTGGLEEEQEDIRVHTIQLDDALDLVDSGEITVLPFIAMLNWIARKRESLRTSA